MVSPLVVISDDTCVIADDAYDAFSGSLPSRARATSRSAEHVITITADDAYDAFSDCTRSTRARNEHQPRTRHDTSCGDRP